GTRRMTTYGERVARELAGACASEGVVVVSGLAQGIDSAAHRGALDGGGRTVAVLGEGIVLFLATVRGRRRPLVPRIRANGAQAVLAVLGVEGPARVAPPTDPILEALSPGALDADALRRRVRMTEGELAQRLLRLTLAGLVTKTPDGRYCGVREADTPSR